MDLAYPRIIEECADAVRQVMPDNSVSKLGRSGSYSTSDEPSNVEVSGFSKSWPCLFPQHGPGPKHRRRIWLAEWQQRLAERLPEALLRGLIHSDGCRFQNTGRSWSHPRYSFANTSEDIKAIFCEVCDLMGLHWTASGEKTIYVSRKADVATLDRFVGPKA